MNQQFYLQDSRTDVGDGLMFRALGSGYTTNLDKAELFTREQACSHRDTDRRLVHKRDVDIKEALKGTGIVLTKAKRRPPASIQNCGGCGRFVPSPSYEDCRHCDHDNCP